MPELPEVQVTVDAITPFLLHQCVSACVVRQPTLRYPIPEWSLHTMLHQRIVAVKRRAKYILIHTQPGTLLIHLGMSGSLMVVTPSTPAKLHEHVDWYIGSHILRLRDPRRFGAVLFAENTTEHAVLHGLGVEPLSPAFCPEMLYTACQKRCIAIKTLLMDQRVVVGIGNIYANEILFCAKIHPATPAATLPKKHITRLVHCTRHVLQEAIACGGSSLKDYVHADQSLGFFQRRVAVYGRDQQPCVRCGHPVAKINQAQRSTYYCPLCQKRR